eukprot:GEMP01056087.1.p1 GENE.GEMP01056087.1~~GEMP01056087.1.p1  ORF type:complete len:191 (+),score=35.00 GEMP01056087.1:177-749(+)
MFARAQRVVKFVVDRKVRFAQLTVSCTLGTLGLLSLKRIPTGHAGVVENLQGDIKPYIFSDSQMAIVIPIWESLIPMRLLPVKKRFVKKIESSDGEVMVRMVTRLQPKVHWLPDIYRQFGKDYGRSFLEREMTFELGQVTKKYTKDQLINGSDEFLDGVADEIKLRLADACEFHMLRVSLDDTTVIFVEP